MREAEMRIENMRRRTQNYLRPSFQSNAAVQGTRPAAGHQPGHASRLDQAGNEESARAAGHVPQENARAPGENPATPSVSHPAGESMENRKNQQAGNSVLENRGGGSHLPGHPPQNSHGGQGVSPAPSETRPFSQNIGNGQTQGQGSQGSRGRAGNRSSFSGNPSGTPQNGSSATSQTPGGVSSHRSPQSQPGWNGRGNPSNSRNGAVSQNSGVQKPAFPNGSQNGFSSGAGIGGSPDQRSFGTSPGYNGGRPRPSPAMQRQQPFGGRTDPGAVPPPEAEAPRGPPPSSQTPQQAQPGRDFPPPGNPFAMLFGGRRVPGDVPPRSFLDNLLPGLHLDSDKILLIALLILLSREGGNMKLMLALGYLLL